MSTTIEFLKNVSLKSYVDLNNIVRTRERVNPNDDKKKALLFQDKDGKTTWMRASSKLDPNKPMMVCYCKAGDEEFPLVTNESEANFTEIEL